MFDVTLTLALHREGSLLRRTLLSLREAASHARTEGITVELVATLDRADEMTRQVLRDFGLDGFDGWTVAEVDHGSLGLSRNSGVKVARGRYIAICDGDDLVSFNSITAMFRLAESAGEKNVIFPQYLYAFGERYYRWKYFPLTEVTPLSFLEAHPYISRAFAHRSVFKHVPYADSSLSPGYAYEDWHFNAECVARGYGILVATDTILFYRQRSGSLLDQTNKLSARQIRPCTLFEPETWVRMTREAYEAHSPFGGVLHDAPDGTGWGAVIDSVQHRTYIQAANAIDPAVKPELVRASIVTSNLSDVRLTAGLAFHEICRIIGGQRFDEVFLLPFIATGGAERYIRDVMNALYEMRPTARMLVVLGEPLAQGSYVDRVPPNATVLDLAGDWPQLAMESRHLIALKLIQAVAPEARLHLRPSAFAHGFLQRFKSVLPTNPIILYRFSDRTGRPSAGILTRASDLISTRLWDFEFVSDHVGNLTFLVSDNQAIIRRDRERIGAPNDKWRYLPARVAPVVTVNGVTERGMKENRRVLWASRLDQEKRPDLLPLIAKHLARVAPEIRIDAFGSAVLGGFDVRRISGLPNLCYGGPFDGFVTLDHGAYDAFVYTTAFDGMPNVVLEAVAVGLPVIAPDVGGIGEIIVDGESGVLLPALAKDDEMAAAYAAAIARLVNDSRLRARLAVEALRRLIERHAPEAYLQAASKIFGDGTTDAAAARSDPTNGHLRPFDPCKSQQHWTR